MSELPPAIIEYACAFEAYRRLGFLAADIYFCLDHGRVFAMLRTQGKVFTVACGSIEGSRADVKAVYDQFVEGFADWTDEFFEAAFKRSVVGTRSAEFLLGLKAKGFSIPCEQLYGKPAGNA